VTGHYNTDFCDRSAKPKELVLYTIFHVVRLKLLLQVLLGVFISGTGSGSNHNDFKGMSDSLQLVNQSSWGSIKLLAVILDAISQKLLALPHTSSSFHSNLIKASFIISRFWVKDVGTALIVFHQNNLQRVGLHLGTFWNVHTVIIRLQPYDKIHEFHLLQVSLLSSALCPNTERSAYFTLEIKI